MRLLEAQRLILLAVSPALSGCAGVLHQLEPAPGIQRPTDGVDSSTVDMVAVDPARLLVTSGAIERRTATEFEVRSSGMRAQMVDGHASAAELRFRYVGATRETVPLGSGELRRQLGLKLRAQDTCNVVYVMWHVEPEPKLEVAVKYNPGQHEHAECRDRGYQFPAPVRSTNPPDIRRSSAQHTLRAVLTGQQLRVLVDGQLSWAGSLPPDALALEGPAGLRSDNGIFMLELRAPARSAR